MDLTQWCATPPALRPEPAPDEVVEEAARRLASELKGRPEIVDVRAAPGWIQADTRMHSGDMLPWVPHDYHGIPVRQAGIGDEIAAFQGTWRAVLRNIAGWDEARIELWIGAHEWVFRSCFFGCDSPLDFVADVLCPPELMSDLGACASGWIADAMAAGVPAVAGRWDPGRWHPDTRADFDWPAARTRVNETIRQLRAHIQGGSSASSTQGTKLGQSN